MEFVLSMTIFAVAISGFSLASAIFGILYMHNTAAAKNKKLSPAWYVCGVLFSFWTLIAFLVKSKDFPGEDTKVCPQCGDRFFSRFEICPKCLVELPDINSDEKQKQKSRGRAFGIMVLVCYVLIGLSGFVSNAVIDNMDWDDAYYRIAVDGVFYDKKGIAYENEDDVLLYDEDGHVYTRTLIELDENGYRYEGEFYIRDDGEKYLSYDCYVTSDGWFYCDKGGLLEPYYPDTSSMTEEELDEYYKEYMEDYYEEYRYYNDYCVDSDGNIYYWADEASWNAEGELILAHNDVSLPE